MSAARPRLDGDDRLPVYQRLADDFRQRITTGDWRPGDRAPSETSLSETYGVAPGTVRQALATLVDEGLMERFRGKGTFVRRPKFDRSLFRFFRFRDGSGMKQAPEARILRRVVEPMPGHVSALLELGDGAEGIFMTRVRLLGGEPALAEDIWLSAELFAAFMDLPEARIGPLLYPVYEATCGQLVASADESLTAEAASEAHARLLRITPGAPVIVIERVARGIGGRPLEWRRSRGRADQFHYTTQIR